MRLNRYSGPKDDPVGNFLETPIGDDDNKLMDVVEDTNSPALRGDATKTSAHASDFAGLSPKEEAVVAFASASAAPNTPLRKSAGRRITRVRVRQIEVKRLRSSVTRDVTWAVSWWMPDSTVYGLPARV